MITTDLYERALKAFGEPHQIGIAIEELGELVTALSRKHYRKRGTDAEVLSEIADAHIMLQQLNLIYGVDNVKSMMHRKLNKLRLHVEKKEKEHDA